jgi:peroxiredoxin Q/BCP
MLKVGDKAPDFTLSDQNDSSVRLSDFKGQWIVLYFYPKDNTPGCTTEACDFTASIGDFKNLDAPVIGISPDSTKSHRGFIEKQKPSLTLLSDPDHKVLDSYGAWQKKQMYGKEFMGVVRSTFLIDPQGGIAYIWPKVSVSGHVSEVKEKLYALKKK